MDGNYLQGSLVHLTAEEPQVLAESIFRWSQDSEFWRLAMVSPANQFSLKKLSDWIQKDQEKDPPGFYAFAIRTLEGDRLIGTCELGGDIFPHGEVFVGIGIGERALWGKGYGTDAMNVVLGYAFQELNVRRVSLSTSENNSRAIRSYEKAGFLHEGRIRGEMQRDGRRWDSVYMGILREEWLATRIMTDA